MYFLSLGAMLCFNAIADTEIHLDQNALSETQAEIHKQVNSAIAKMPQTSKELSTVNLKSLNLSDTDSQIKQSQNSFKNIKPLTNKLPNGEKYYL